MTINSLFRRIPPYSAAVLGGMQKRGIGGRRSYSAAAVFPIGGGMNSGGIGTHAPADRFEGPFRRITPATVLTLTTIYGQAIAAFAFIWSLR